MLAFFREHEEILACPRCRGSLHVADATVTCEGCKHIFAIDSEMPLLFAPNDWDPAKPDVTHDVQAFYEKTPFPNYDDFDSIGASSRRRSEGSSRSSSTSRSPSELGSSRSGAARGK